MSQDKDELYLDDLLEEVNSHPMNYDDDTEENKKDSTSTGEDEEFNWGDVFFQNEEEDKSLNDLDNIVENLLDNLDDNGSLENSAAGEKETESDSMDDLDALMNSLTQEEVREPESLDSEDSGVDDLLSLLSDTDFQAMSEEEMEPQPQNNAEEDILSLEDLSELHLDHGMDVLTEEEAPAGMDTLKKNMDPAAEEKKKGVSVFQKLFGNVHDEKAKKKQEKEIKKQEEKEKKKKPKKTKEELEEEKKLKAQEKKEKQAAAKKIKEAKKKEKEERKQKKKEDLAVEEEIDEGRINRLGATVVFLFFGLIAVGIIFGGRGFSYKQSIAKATEYFGVQSYNEAYDEVRGVTVKEDDKEIYDKIITIMYVNKQLNSYSNYYAMKMYPEALDSLLKGLKRYEEYISYAEELGIEGDMDYVRGQILGELGETYQISEKEAYQIIKTENQEEYSRLVLEKAGELR